MKPRRSGSSSGRRPRPPRERAASRPAPSRVGKRGAVVIPSELRRSLGIDEGSIVLFERHDDGILIRPAEVVPVEVYSAERRAEFLLNGATSQESYRWAVQEVRRMGLDPGRIPHLKPGRE